MLPFQCDPGIRHLDESLSARANSITCSPGAANALDGALNGLVPGHGQVEHHGRRPRCVGAAQAPASARSSGRLLRCTCQHASNMWRVIQ